MIAVVKKPDMKGSVDPALVADLKSSMSSMPMMPQAKGDHDVEMVLTSLRSIRRTTQILERLICGCEPVPSWAEAKIYNSSKDFQSVLGYMLGSMDEGM
jgi:hypothetical protein